MHKTPATPQAKMTSANVAAKEVKTPAAIEPEAAPAAIEPEAAPGIRHGLRLRSASSSTHNIMGYCGTARHAAPGAGARARAGEGTPAWRH